MGAVRCFLCGGRVSNGVCTECGMPQRKRSEEYNLNNSPCDAGPMTHVHDHGTEDRRKSNRATHDGQGNRQKSYRTEHAGYSTGQQRYKNERMAHVRRQEERTSAGTRRREGTSEQRIRQNRAARGIAVIVVCVIIIVSIVGLVENNHIDFSGNDMNWENHESSKTYSDDYYDFVTYEISDSGESYTDTLYAGYYTVGYDLPEGVYTMNLESGSGSVEINNDGQKIYMYESLGTDYGYETLENVRLYQGTQIIVSGGTELEVSTENAQMAVAASKAENPLDPVSGTVEVADHALVAGIDFPEGTYDIWCTDSFGVVSLTYGQSGTDDYETYGSFLIQSEKDAQEYSDMDDYAVCIYNVNMKSGMSVYASGTPLKLVPSKYAAADIEIDDTQEGEQNVQYY